MEILKFEEISISEQNFTEDEKHFIISAVLCNV